MMYLVTDGGVKSFDDDYQPIELDAALVAIQRVSKDIEAMYARYNQDATATVDNGAEANNVATKTA